jgi:hypothetical protein
VRTKPATLSMDETNEPGGSKANVSNL